VRGPETWVHRDRDQEDARDQEVHREIAESAPEEKSRLMAHSRAGGIGKLLRTEPRQSLDAIYADHGIRRDRRMPRRNYGVQMIDSEER
jgi:hypothetical protein